MTSKKKPIQSGKTITDQDILSVHYDNRKNMLTVVVQFLSSDNAVVNVTKTLEASTVQNELDALITAIDNEV